MYTYYIMVERVPVAVAYESNKMFAKKYCINLTYVVNGKRKKKSLKQFQREIYDYEERNNITNGMYF